MFWAQVVVFTYRSPDRLCVVCCKPQQGMHRYICDRALGVSSCQLYDSASGFLTGYKRPSNLLSRFGLSVSLAAGFLLL